MKDQRAFSYPLLSWDVYDGDTVKCVIDRGWGDSKKVACRIVNTDAPEKRSRNQDEKDVAQLVRLCVVYWLETRGNLHMASFDRGKYYGRCVGDIESGGEFLSNWLLQHKIVNPYNGQSARAKWTPRMLTLVRNRCREILP